MARCSAIAILALAICFTAGHAGRDLRREETGPTADALHTIQYRSIAPSPNGDNVDNGDGTYVAGFGIIVDPHPTRKINSSIRWGLLPPGWQGSIIPKFGWPWWFPNWPGWLPRTRRPFHDHLPQVSVTPGPRRPPFILP